MDREREREQASRRMGHFARVTNRDNSSVLAGCYRELSSRMNEAGCRLYLRPRASSPDKAGKPQSSQMLAVHRIVRNETCPKIIHLPGPARPANRPIMRCALQSRSSVAYWVIEVIWPRSPVPA